MTWLMNAADYFRNKSRAYKLTFASPSGQEVLEDLATFCRANESCFHADPRMHAVAEGRREVWLRIQQHMNMTPDQLFDFFTRQKPTLTAQPGGHSDG